MTVQVPHELLRHSVSGLEDEAAGQVAVADDDGALAQRGPDGRLEVVVPVSRYQACHREPADLVGAVPGQIAEFGSRGLAGGQGRCAGRGETCGDERRDGRLAKLPQPVDAATTGGAQLSPEQTCGRPAKAGA
jgi:hypothetical protein